METHQTRLLNLATAAAYLSREVTRLLEEPKGPDGFALDYALGDAQDAAMAFVLSLTRAMGAAPYELPGDVKW
jgi:hypothetical protein